MTKDPCQIPRTIRLTAADEALLTALSSDLRATRGEVLRWALRFFATSPPPGLIDRATLRHYQDIFGHLQVGPSQWVTASAWLDIIASNRPGDDADGEGRTVSDDGLGRTYEPRELDGV